MPGLLACPGCARLVHAERLAKLAARAEAAETAGDAAGALDAWREALGLLPPSTLQHARVAERVAGLAERPDARRRLPTPPGGWASAAGVVALAALVLSKAKFLALGLTKAGTVFGMLASFGVYWAAYGWTFGLGLVLSIYVHEMGHVAELVRRGIPVSAPMFIPGLGAYVRLGARPASPVEDARIGLAGPTWGLGAALACLLAHLATGSPLLASLARAGAWINLFNLLPVWQLDGGRGFASLTRWQRLVATAGIVLAWAVTREGLLLLIAIAAAARGLAGRQVEKPDQIGLALYLGLVAALSALTLVKVPEAG